MDEAYLEDQWKREEAEARIRGWDFSHICGRYQAADALPWDYREIALGHLRPDTRLLDCDTGGGEFLLSLGHPYDHTSATEGYPPNIALCREKLLPLGIDFKPCSDPASIPFADGSFDVILNRHGAFRPSEINRLLDEEGLFITQQVGGDNDRELVEMVLPGTEKPFPDMDLATQSRRFEEAGFTILRAQEAFFPIRFYDVGAFVWFARVIEWEFPGFSVDRCLDRLLTMHRRIERDGYIQGTAHRYLVVAAK